MNTILVATDYSATAKNAAVYAIHLAVQLEVKKIVLYNAYQAPPVITETALMPAAAVPFFNIEDLRSISNTGMQHFKESVQSICPANMEIDQQTEYAALDTDINEICKTTGADMIVMGITGTGKIEEILTGSTAISVMENTKVPVIVVPADARYTTVKNIMLACDYKKVAEATPVKLIKKILDATKASLHIVNVSESEKEITADKTQQQEVLHSVFQEYNPHFHFEQNENFITGINNFTDANNIDLVIAIPKKHTFFQGLFKERHAKKLAFHSHVPLIYVHEEDL